MVTTATTPPTCLGRCSENWQVVLSEAPVGGDMVEVGPCSTHTVGAVLPHPTAAKAYADDV
jgi:hypothetical protein